MRIKRNAIRPGEVFLKAWRAGEAERLRIGESAVAMRMSRGKYPNLVIRTVSERVKYVVLTTAETVAK